MLRSLINQRLGRYHIKALLGRGGMAAVYRASDTVLQRDVALKVLYPQFSDDASLIARFQREAVTAASLEHPNIVPVYDVGEYDGMAYIAMKLLSGETLQERLQAVGALALDELLAVITPVAAALDYAHARGVVHRDVKPANIFLNRSADGEQVVLTDFGIAKQLDTPGLTTTGALIGTPDYMAPEQIAGRPVDARSDVYALGMLIYRALTGRRAFEGSTQDVLLGHLYSRPTPPSQLNPALPVGIDALVERATAPDPAARYQSAGALVQALRQIARGAAASTAVGGPPVLAPAHPVSSEGLAPASAPTVRGPVLPPAARLPPPAVVRRATPSAAAPGAGPAPAAAARAATLPRADSNRSRAAPWLAAIVLALLAGGLAVALAVALAGRNGAGGPVLPPPVEPASPTSAPPTDTPDPAFLATAEPPTATAEPPTATAEPPTATAELPTATRSPPSSTPAPSATASPTPAPSATASPTLAPSATASPTLAPTDPPSPTATVEPTLTPSVTLETPTVQAGCAIEVVRGFGRIYDNDVTVRTGLGCPREPEVGGNGSEQFFERGMMFYWDNANRTEKSDHIFVFYGRDEGRYDDLPPQAVADLGDDPTPGPDPNQPLRGFGRVYFFKPGVAEALGAPISPEIELRGNRRGVIQFFDQGMMIFTPLDRQSGGASIFVLYDDGAFQRFDDTFGG
ncbi:MAG: hypothetical protein OHK0015_40620 [Chloroflexi bacterium OHK40]